MKKKRTEQEASELISFIWENDLDSVVLVCKRIHTNTDNKSALNFEVDPNTTILLVKNMKTLDYLDKTSFFLDKLEVPITSLPESFIEKFEFSNNTRELDFYLNLEQELKYTSIEKQVYSQNYQCFYYNISQALSKLESLNILEQKLENTWKNKYKHSIYSYRSIQLHSDGSLYVDGEKSGGNMNKKKSQYKLIYALINLYNMADKPSFNEDEINDFLKSQGMIKQSETFEKAAENFNSNYFTKKNYTIRWKNEVLTLKHVSD